MVMVMTMGGMMRNSLLAFGDHWGLIFFTTSIGGIYHSLTSDMKLGHDRKIVLSYSLSPTCHSKTVSSSIAWFVPLVFLFVFEPLRFVKG